MTTTMMIDNGVKRHVRFQLTPPPPHTLNGWKYIMQRAAVNFKAFDRYQ